MNRQIKFRGKTESGHWVYGTPVYYQSGEVCIFNDNFDHYGCEATNIAAARDKVDPATVGQFTGMKDRDGKDIYEGDIMSMILYGITVIIWNEGICAFQYAYDGQTKGTAIGGKITNTLYDFEYKKRWVCGNIHDNPELFTK